MAPRQPPLLTSHQLQARVAAPRVRRLVQDPLVEEDKQSSVEVIDLRVDEAALHERQACSQLLDQVAIFCGLEGTGITDTTKVILMMIPRIMPN